MRDFQFISSPFEPPVESDEDQGQAAICGPHQPEVDSRKPQRSDPTESCHKAPDRCPVKNKSRSGNQHKNRQKNVLVTDDFEYDQQAIGGKLETYAAGRKIDKIAKGVMPLNRLVAMDQEGRGQGETGCDIKDVEELSIANEAVET